MPRSELDVHRSRALGSSNDERMSSLLRQHYLLRVFNIVNNSREHFVTPVTANKVFRSFLAPRDGKSLLYTVCVCMHVWSSLCWVLAVYKTAPYLPEETKRVQVSCRRRYCWVFYITVIFVDYFPPQMHRQLVTMSRLRRCPFFHFVWKVHRTIFYPPGWCFFYLVLGRLDFLHKLN